MSRAQVLKFREEFRKNHIPKWYNGWLHLGFNAAVLVAALVFCFSKLYDVQVKELWTIPLTLLLGNLAVFIIHRYPLHRHYGPFAKFSYDIHSKWHHSFYSHEMVIYEKTDDFYVLFFPPLVIASFCAFYLPGSYFLLKHFFSMNITFLFMGVSTLYFILYEVMHFISHLPEDHVVLDVPLFKMVWAHHVDHHQPDLMHKYNFNIVFPFFDYVFGTVYKGPNSFQKK